MPLTSQLVMDMPAPKLALSLAVAMRVSMKGYQFDTFRRDAIAGLVVSLLALPLAMALAIAVGLPPQHGIYTAIVAGVAAALFGGSLTQVSGPTAAFVVIVAPIVSQYGLHGIIWCEMMAGVMLILMGVARFGRYISYVPYPVTTGFTAGIAVVIATLALNDFLGLGIPKLSGAYIDKLALIFDHLPQMNPYELMVGVVTLLLILCFGKVTRVIPTTVVGIAAGTGLALLFARYGIEIATIGSRFSYETAAGLVQGIPPYPPSFHLPTSDAASLWHWPDYAEFKTLLTPALVIAALAALESLLSATVADGMAGTRHDPNAELSGIGIANILCGLAGGIPATGAIARTAANIHNGARTPVAAILHALLIMLYVLLLAPLIRYIPMASLAALLLVTAYRMSHFKQCIRTLTIAPASDSLVLLTCFGLTVFVDMVAGVSVGIVLASLLFMRRVAAMTEFELAPLPAPAALPGEITTSEQIMVYHIEGPLFFGTAQKAFSRTRMLRDHVHTLIIDLAHVPLIDMTGLVALKSLLADIAREGRTVILCGKPEITDKILQKIAGTSFAPHVRTATSLDAAVGD